MQRSATRGGCAEELLRAYRRRRPRVLARCQQPVCQWRRDPGSSTGTTTSWPSPGRISWSHPGQRYAFTAWYGCTWRTSTASGSSSVKRWATVSRRGRPRPRAPRSPRTRPRPRRCRSAATPGSGTGSVPRAHGIGEIRGRSQTGRGHAGGVEPMTQVMTRAELEAGRAHALGSPVGRGVVEMVVVRPEPGARTVLEQAVLDPVVGMVGDCWLARGSRHTEDGSASPLMQLTLMNARVADLVAGARDRWPLAGDQLYVDLDLGAANLAPGARLRRGDRGGGGHRATAHRVRQVRRAVRDRGRPLREHARGTGAPLPGDERAGGRGRRGAPR